MYQIYAKTREPNKREHERRLAICGASLGKCEHDAEQASDAMQNRGSKGKRHARALPVGG
jgi:hypothetical protein